MDSDAAGHLQVQRVQSNWGVRGPREGGGWGSGERVCVEPVQGPRHRVILPLVRGDSCVPQGTSSRGLFLTTQPCRTHQGSPLQAGFLLSEHSRALNPELAGYQSQRERPWPCLSVPTCFKKPGFQSLGSVLERGGGGGSRRERGA